MAGLRKASVAFSGEGNGKKTCLFEPHGYFTALPQLQAVPFFIASLVGFRPVVNQLSAPPPHSLKQKASSPGQGVSWPHIFASPLETPEEGTHGLFGKCGLWHVHGNWTALPQAHGVQEMCV